MTNKKMILTATKKSHYAAELPREAGDLMLYLSTVDDIEISRLWRVYVGRGYRASEVQKTMIQQEYTRRHTNVWRVASE